MQPGLAHGRCRAVNSGLEGIGMADTALLAPLEKFSDPDVTAHGERRARVALAGLRTLWINTGTLCNITCRNCYIDRPRATTGSST